MIGMATTLGQINDTKERVLKVEYIKLQGFCMDIKQPSEALKLSKFELVDQKCKGLVRNIGTTCMMP